VQHHHFAAILWRISERSLVIESSRKTTASTIHRRFVMSGLYADGRPFIVHAPRGLTASVYPNEFAPNGMATTYYVR
jgi:hypothetical protein